MFSTKLKELRSLKGITQEELANILGVRQQTIGKWELSITVPRLPMLQKIGAFFNVSVDYLLGRTDEPQGTGFQKGLLGDINGDSPLAQKARETKNNTSFGLSIQGDLLLIDDVELHLHHESADRVKKAIEIALHDELDAAKKKSRPTMAQQADADGNIYLTEKELLEYDVHVDSLGNMFCTIDSQMYKVIKLDNGMYMLSPLSPLDPKPGKKKKEIEYRYAA